MQPIVLPIVLDFTEARRQMNDYKHDLDQLNAYSNMVMQKIGNAHQMALNIGQNAKKYAPGEPSPTVDAAYPLWSVKYKAQRDDNWLINDAMLVRAEGEEAAIEQVQNKLRHTFRFFNVTMLECERA